MDRREELQALVDLVNGWENRPSNKPLLRLANCQYCGDPFPVVVQDYNNNGGLLTDGKPECRRRLKAKQSVAREIRRKARLSATTEAGKER
jgi:hypothetical protein